MVVVLDNDCGSTDITARVIGPSGHVTSELVRTQSGVKISYVPLIPGAYKVQLYLSGVEIPGMWALYQLMGLFYNQL